MTTSAPTIIDLKLQFLTSQILALSTPLSPSDAFLDSNASLEENALRQKSIDEALHKLNGLLRKHNRLAYGPQAKRHVVEQISKLFWQSAERGVSAVGEEWSERGADYRKEEIISQLPEEWSEEAQAKAPEQAAKYKVLQQKLAELNERRKLARERLEGYKSFKERLDMFVIEEGDLGLQRNLVTKNGEIEQELEKMRMLMLRVTRGVDLLDEKGDAEMDENEDWEREEEEKLLRLLADDP